MSAPEEKVALPTSQGTVDGLFRDAAGSTLVVMVHGLASNMHTQFYAAVPGLCAHATLRFDLAGHGGSGGRCRMLYRDQLAQLNEVLAQFPRFTRRVLIGHSKGSTLAFLAARDRDSVVSVAGRWNLGQQPPGRYTESEMEQINAGAVVQHKFGKLLFDVGRESFEERQAMDMPALVAGKTIRVLVLAGTRDQVVPGGDQIEMASHFGVEVNWVDCGHSGFSPQLVADALAKFIV